MRLNSINDIRLTGRALVSGWLNDCESRKQQAVNELFDVVNCSQDEEMKVKAFTALVKAGEADIKREELALKQQARDEEKRLRLLELLKHVPAGTLAAIASRHKSNAGSNREDVRKD
jgi:hypothetical protein